MAYPQHPVWCVSHEETVPSYGSIRPSITAISHELHRGSTCRMPQPNCVWWRGANGGKPRSSVVGANVGTRERCRKNPFPRPCARWGSMPPPRPRTLGITFPKTVRPCCLGRWISGTTSLNPNVGPRYRMPRRPPRRRGSRPKPRRPTLCLPRFPIGGTTRWTSCSARWTTASPRPSTSPSRGLQAASRA